MDGMDNGRHGPWSCLGSPVHLVHFVHRPSTSIDVHLRLAEDAYRCFSGMVGWRPPYEDIGG